MSKFIDTNDVSESFIWSAIVDGLKCKNSMSDIADDIVQYISEINEAYNTEKVIEQLEKERAIAFLTLANTGKPELDEAYQQVACYMDKAIEIVKRGGLNDD